MAKPMPVAPPITKTPMPVAKKKPLKKAAPKKSPLHSKISSMMDDGDNY